MSGDPGLFGPDSIAWRIHSDPTTIVGGMAALLLQALNPRAMAGVAEHSNFRGDPWGRFQRTAAFVMTATYGTTAEAERAGARVRHLHLRVVGTEPTSGAPYSANDPDLLAWVHNALAFCLLAAYRRYGGGLSDTDADRYLREMVGMAELVGTPADLVPTTVADLDDYLRTAPLEASRTAQAAKWTVLTPPLPARLRGPWLLADAAAVALLPARARRCYGFVWFPPADAPLQAAMRLVTVGLRHLLPPPPARVDAEARLAAAS